MTETALQQPGRELDALVHQRVHGVATEMRLCMRDPESGVWEEVQRHYEQQGEPVKEGEYDKFQPCWLRHIPLPDDWTDEDRQQYPDADSEWEVVPHYSTRIENAWLLVEWAMDTGRVCHIKADGLRDKDTKRYTIFAGPHRADTHTAAHGICLTVLQQTEQWHKNCGEGI